MQPGADSGGATDTGPQDTRDAAFQVPETGQSSGGGPAGAVLCPALRDPKMTCGTNDFCCFDTAGRQGACEGVGSTCASATNVALQCGTPQDCPGGVCCATGGPNGSVIVSCQDTCTSTAFCSGLGADGDCPSGQHCVASMHLPGFFICE
jgi:hypothetical protein